MSKKTLSFAALSGLSASLLTGAALAHHSAAMFDEKKLVVLTGTVKEFQWTQPHGWIVMMVPDPKGGPPTEWRTETGAPTLMMRMGLQKNDIPAGSKITLRVHPLRDGRPAGELYEALRADGSVMARMGPPQPAAGGPGGPPPGPPGQRPGPGN